jgi:hypothetical protein
VAAGRVKEKKGKRARHVGRALEHGMTPHLVLLALLLGAAVWLAATGFVVAWWMGGAGGWAALWAAAAAAGLLFWTMAG